MRALAAALALALPLAARDGAPAGDGLDVPSGNGWYRAELRRAPGSERAPAPLARWRVEVVPAARNPAVPEDEGALWSAALPFDGSADGWVLADDGSALARVSRDFQEYRPVVTLLREGRALTGPSGSAFDVPTRVVERTDGGRLWLADDGLPRGTVWLETDTGPRPALALRLRDGNERLLDLADGRVWSADDFAELARVRVAPELPHRLEGLVALPYVAALHVPALARAGHPLPVTVVADHPTPGWRFEGFRLAQSGQLGRDLTLETLSRGPAGGLAAQVLQPLRPVAELAGLAPARYRVRAPGRASPSPDWQEFAVLPADHLLRLRRTGGIAGLDESWTVLGRGELEHAPGGSPGDGGGALRRARVPRATLARLAELLGRLPAESRGTTARAADLFHYRLTTWDGALPVERACDDGTADATWRELVRLVTSL